jgi:hypothetical protein
MCIYDKIEKKKIISIRFEIHTARYILSNTSRREGLLRVTRNKIFDSLFSKMETLTKMKIDFLLASPDKTTPITFEKPKSMEAEQRKKSSPAITQFKAPHANFDGLDPAAIRQQVYSQILMTHYPEGTFIQCNFSPYCKKVLKGPGNLRRHFEHHLRHLENHTRLATASVNLKRKMNSAIHPEYYMPAKAAPSLHHDTEATKKQRRHEETPSITVGPF